MGFPTNLGEYLMSDTRKQAVTVALDPPDLEHVKRLAERERGTPSGVIRRFVAERLQALQDRAPTDQVAA
jgi:hypothetical protein